MSYTIEVYRGKQAPERNLGMFALYVLFFPQLVAGPIERPQNLLYQFREVHHFDYDQVSRGLQLIFWGLFQKMVIADRLAVIVDKIYSHPNQFGGLTLAFATVLFAFQIFCDFAGYSDVAIGTAQVLGFKLMTNFRQPYLATSVAEFWKRWHISLSTWFRDYVYLPLGGNRKGPAAAYRQRADCVRGERTVAWGGLEVRHLGSAQRVFVVMTGMRGTNASWIPTIVRRLATFVLVCSTWVFFRAGSVGEAFTIFRRLLPLRANEIVADIGAAPIAIAICLVAFSVGMQLVRERYRVREMISCQPSWLRWPAYAAAMSAILLFGEFHSRDFIYFQF